MKRLTFIALAVLGMLSALPAANAADAAGKWHFVLDTPGGDRDVNAEFKIEDGKLTGKWGDADVTGTFADGTIEFTCEITPEETGEKGTMKINGKLEGEELTGTWEFADYNGTFKATRPS